MNGDPFKVCFGITCSCGVGEYVDISDDLRPIAERDPVAALRLLSKHDQRKLMEFYSEHSMKEHMPEPALVSVAPMDDPATMKACGGGSA